MENSPAGLIIAELHPEAVTRYVSIDAAHRMEGVPRLEEHDEPIGRIVRNLDGLEVIEPMMQVARAA